MLCLGCTGLGIGRLLLLRAPVGRAGEPALGWAQCVPLILIFRHIRAAAG